ncbi:hypothetical protein NDU88_007024 [Pleurodeles waltl]|uniref:Uncharacterized protein n=1 Tax=Pleurodeles waltl TaxID=8319 RepID=A0AAV7LQU7_PLEWA|nr:hypothetical protein NDU88_007024 [Pleurodeles waltl]
METRHRQQAKDSMSLKAWKPDPDSRPYLRVIKNMETRPRQQATTPCHSLKACKPDPTTGKPDPDSMQTRPRQHANQTPTACKPDPDSMQTRPRQHASAAQRPRICLCSSKATNLPPQHKGHESATAAQRPRVCHCSIKATNLPPNGIFLNTEKNSRLHSGLRGAELVPGP